MPGFAFWGLFLIFGLIVVLYLAWMVWVERREERRGGPGAGPGAGSP